MKTSSKGINALCGMKGWFIFSVVIYHTFNNTGALTDILSPFKSYGGYFGNYIFFMMSGFLTAYSFSNIKISECNFLSYISKKLLRLWPLYALCNIWQLGFIVYKNGLATFRISDLILVLLMQTGGALTDNYPYIVPGWFLCTLMVCYILNYLIRYICKNDANRNIWFFYCFVIWGLILLSHNFDAPFCYVHDGEGITNFFIGSILFEHYYFFKKKKVLLYIFLLPCCLFLIFNTPVSFGDIRYVFSFIICPGLILLALEETVINRFFNNQVSLFLGRISMCVYMMHILSPLTYIPEMFAHYTLGYLIYLLMLILISAITTKLITPIITRKPLIVEALSYKNFE